MDNTNPLELFSMPDNNENTDDVASGRTWNQATLLGTLTRYGWRLWEYLWLTPPRAGRYNIMARATDAGKRVQPMQRDTDRRNYMINHILPAAVDVRLPNP